MVIEKVFLNGFGKLTNIEIEFYPEINLVFGQNEAGKSTLQQAILHLLFGFYQSNRARPQETALLERFYPWQTDQYCGQLWFQLKDERRFQISRDFADSDIPTHIFDVLTGQEITDRFETKRHGNVLFFRDFLGMDKELFEATAFVRQAEVKSIAGAGHLVNEIIGILDSGSRDTSAKYAITNLQQKITEIGTERAQKKPLPRLKARLQNLKEELDAQFRAREELKQAIMRKSELEILVTKEENHRIELNYHILTKNIDSKEKQLNQLRKLQKEAEQLNRKMMELSDVEQFPQEIKESVSRKKQNRQNYEEQIEEKNQSIRELGTQVEELEQQLEPFKRYENIVTLMPYNEFVNYSKEWHSRRQILTDAQEKVDQEELILLQDGIEPKSLQEIQNLKPSDFNQFSQTEEKLKDLEIQVNDYQDQIKELEKETWATKKSRIILIVTPLILFAAVLILSYFYAFSFGYPIAAGILTLGVVIYQFFRRARKKIAQKANTLEIKAKKNQQERDELKFTLQKQYQRFGVDSVNMLITRRMQNEQYLDLLRKRDNAKQEFERSEFQLQKYLQSIEIEKITEKTLVQVDREYEKFNEHYTRLKTLQQQKQQVEKDIENYKNKIKENNAALKELFVQANIENPELPAAELEFDRLYQRKKQLNQYVRENEKLESEKRGILSSYQSENDIHKELEDYILRREKLLTNFPDVQGKKSRNTLTQLEKDFAEVDLSKQKHEQELRELQGRIETVFEQFRPQSEVEEELAQVQEEVDRMEGFRVELEIARDVLIEVAQNYHRNVIPQMNQTISDAMNRITNNRYSKVHINPDDLSLNLLLPEKNTLGSADMLSMGTQEQLYLLLRVALARLLSQNMEPIPLILDDPFVHFDHSRMKNILEFLYELSQENQVILFSKEPFIMEWWQKKLEKTNVKPIDLVALTE